MLITTCSQCGSRFRVTPQQLNERQGQVRCGKCRKVFNGFEGLERFPDDDTGTRLLAAQDPALVLPEASPAAEPALEEEPLDIETLDAAPPLDLPLDAQPAASPGAFPEPAVRAPTRRDLRYPEARNEELRGQDRPEPDLRLEEPPVRRPSRAWAFGVALMLVVLAVEGTYATRGLLAQRYPVLRPTLESACATLRCKVPWSHDESLLKLEESDMLEVPGKASEIALGARIRNLASVAQEYPHLELTLSDFTGQPATRRVLRPTDYLGRPLATGDVMAPGAEIAIQLRLETPRIKPTGYELLLFYP